MLPHCSHQICRPASAVVASSKLVRNAAESIAETDTSVNDVVVQPKSKQIEQNSQSNEAIVPILQLPFEILERFFNKIDDYGFLNLANTCTRFESIALAVAEKRYADQYFEINSERYGGDRELYEEIFSRFGSYINAIKVNHITNLDAKHWVAKMLRPHISHITKLAVNACTFDRKNIFSHIMHQITHLTVRNTHLCKTFTMDDLLDCRKLVLFNFREPEVWHDKSTLKQIMRNNPGLQSIFAYGLDIELFREHLIWDHLNEIKEVGQVKLDMLHHLGPKAIDRIVFTLRSLESLELVFPSRDLELLQRLGFECKRVKRLKLYAFGIFFWDDDLIEAVRPYQKIEYLCLNVDKPNMNEIKTAIKCLPNLTHFCLGGSNFNFPLDAIVPLIRECTSLQVITITMFNNINHNSKFAQFFKDFLEMIAVTGKANARIELEKCGETFATITANGIIYGNKLMYWVGCDTVAESPNINLLQLAKHTKKSIAEKQQSQYSAQKNLLDRIFDHLDVISLYFFAETSPRSKQLVEHYIKTHSKPNGLFTITNEFYRFDRCKRVHGMFAPHATNLQVHNVESRWCDQYFLQIYVYLTKASIYGEAITSLRFPTSLRHLILDGSTFIDYSELVLLLFHSAHIDTIELKNASSFNDFNYEHDDFDGVFKNSKLKTFKFNYRGETQFKNLKKMFNGSQTKLIPVLPSSNQS